MQLCGTVSDTALDSAKVKPVFCCSVEERALPCVVTRSLRTCRPKESRSYCYNGNRATERTPSYSQVIALKADGRQEKLILPSCSHAHEDVPGTVNVQAVEGDDVAYGQALFPVPEDDPNDPLQVRNL
jgi:hypothetical protein